MADSALACRVEVVGSIPSPGRQEWSGGKHCLQAPTSARNTPVGEVSDTNCSYTALLTGTGNKKEGGEKKSD